jgi:SAM-dependent methyltransferase
MKTDPFSNRRQLNPNAGFPCDFINQEPALLEPRFKAIMDSDISQFLLNDTLPIPDSDNREGYYGGYDFEYWLSGLWDYSKVKETLPDIDLPKAHVLDFGGATGRVIRHFFAQEKCESVTLCDVNINNVEWIMNNFLDIAVFKNHGLPHLPIPDSSLDLILAFSVFTHIDIYELTWLYELRRILKDNGVLYLTVHDDETWHVLPTTYVYTVLRESPGFLDMYNVTPELPDRLVFPYSTNDVYNCNMFHTHAYIRHVWSRIFTVEAIIPLAHADQAAVILRKRND